jgi:hypothetical protein
MNSKKRSNELEWIPDQEWDHYSGLPNPKFYEQSDSDRILPLPTRSGDDMVSDK